MCGYPACQSESAHSFHSIPYLYMTASPAPRKPLSVLPQHRCGQTRRRWRCHLHQRCRRHQRSHRRQRSRRHQRSRRQQRLRRRRRSRRHQRSRRQRRSRRHHREHLSPHPLRGSSLTPRRPRWLNHLVHWLLQCGPISGRGLQTCCLQMRCTSGLAWEWALLGALRYLSALATCFDSNAPAVAVPAPSRTAETGYAAAGGCLLPRWTQTLRSAGQSVPSAAAPAPARRGAKMLGVDVSRPIW
mmetsp:Transcript_17625/g.39492  ORF Transcript_17625/g.39492 Transcript_17625/m.39492 type:complete len:243 (-) Transcript_17625:104-832(-)